MFAGDIFSSKLKRVHDLTCLWFLEQEPIKSKSVAASSGLRRVQSADHQVCRSSSSAGRSAATFDKNIFRRLA